MATIALSGAPTRDQSSSERMPLGAWLRTTPGLIRLLSLVAAVGLVAVAVTGIGTLVQRRDATASAATISGPQLVTAGDLYASLAATDAIAASTLLRRGSASDPAALRQRYEDELARADGLLFDLTEGAELSPTGRDAAGAIATELSTYAGLVASARTNGEYGSPVSAAYMRAASDQMRERILPEATTIWSDAATRLRADYSDGTAVARPVAFAVAAVVALVVLLLLATFLALRTRRFLNLGVLAALVVLGVSVAASLVLMAHEHDALARAQRDGSDPLLTLSAAQFLALQGQADLTIALAERDTREAYLHEFDALTSRIGGSEGAPGLLDAARSMSGGTDEAGEVAAAGREFDAYLLVADDARAFDNSVEDRADAGATDPADRLSDASAAVNSRLVAANDTFERRFSAAATDSRAGTELAVVLLAAALALAAACVLIGVQPRIGEYR